MAGSAAITGLGVVLDIGELTIGEIKNITGPGYKTALIDATNSESPNGVREFIAGRKDYGEVTFECHLVPGVEALASALVNRTKQVGCSITYSNGVAHSFDAYVIGFNVTSGDVVKALVTLKAQPAGA